MQQRFNDDLQKQKIVCVVLMGYITYLTSAFFFFLESIWSEIYRGVTALCRWWNKKKSKNDIWMMIFYTANTAQLYQNILSRFLFFE